jgi:hypothetical protein
MTEIAEEAKRLWKDKNFFGICCREKDCKPYGRLLDEGHFEIDLYSNHGYWVTIYQYKTEYGGWYLSSNQEAWWSDDVKAGLSDIKLTKQQCEFWDEAAKLYWEIPRWLVEDFGNDEKDMNCRCSLNTLISKGCQCGGK